MSGDYLEDNILYKVIDSSIKNQKRVLSNENNL